MTSGEWYDRVQALVKEATGNGHVERLEWGMDRPESWVKHLYRYGFAASFIERGDIVLDAACGNGYGRPIIEGHGAEWYGADKNPPYGKTFVVDLETWKPPIAYDVFVGLETIEHLHDPTAYLKAAKRARRRVILSTPIIPTAHFNGFHVVDYTKEQIESFFEEGWTVERFERQEQTYGCWAFTKEPQRFESPALTEPKRSEMETLRERLAKLEAMNWQPDELERMMREHLPPWKRGQ